MPRRHAQLLEGPEGRTLLRLALEMSPGMLAMVSFHLADTWFVSRLGTHALAAMGFTFPVTLVVNGLSLGLGTGASAVISRAVGAGDRPLAARLTTHSLLLALLLVTPLAVAGWLTVDPLFRVLGADARTLPAIRAYMHVWYVGVPLVVIPMVGNSALRATGDARTPSLVMVLASLLNVTLDPLFIFGLGLGIQGAALATLCGRAVVFTVTLSLLRFREGLLRWERPAPEVLLASWKPVLAVGLPAAAMRILAPLGGAAITRLLASFGPAAVAGATVGQRVEVFGLVAVQALAVMLGPFVGQNLGGGRLDRLERGLRLAQRFAAGWGLGLWLLLLPLAPLLARLFSQDEPVLAAAVAYLHLAALGYAGLGLLQVSTSSLNVLHRPVQAALLVGLHVFGLYLPLALLGSHLLGVDGVFAAAAAASLLAGSAAALYSRRVVVALRASRTPSAAG